jgi:hypothetical protein
LRPSSRRPARLRDQHAVDLGNRAAVARAVVLGP